MRLRSLQKLSLTRIEGLSAGTGDGLPVAPSGYAFITKKDGTYYIKANGDYYIKKVT